MWELSVHVSNDVRTGSFLSPFWQRHQWLMSDYLPGRFWLHINLFNTQCLLCAPCNSQCWDRAVDIAVKIFCLYEAYIGRLRKEPTLKPSSLRNVNISQGVIKRSLVKRFYWKVWLACVLVRRGWVMLCQKTGTGESEVVHVYNVMGLVQYGSENLCRGRKWRWTHIGLRVWTMVEDHLEERVISLPGSRALWERDSVLRNIWRENRW